MHNVLATKDARAQGQCSCTDRLMVLEFAMLTVDRHGCWIVSMCC